MSEQTKQKPKGTSKTEAIIGAAANKYTSVTKGLKDAVNEALKMTDLMDEQALKIADQEDRLANLKQEFENKKTQNKIDLDLAYKADQKQFAETYLAANNLIAVPASEYNELRDSVRDWEDKFEDKVNAEVGKANGMAASKLANEQKLIEAQYQAKEAGNLAQINNLQQQLASLKEWNNTLQNQLNDERKASIERAKASAVGSITVANPGR